MSAVDPALVAGAQLLARGQWRAAHDVFENRWRSSTGELRELTHALAQLGAALLKWSEDHPQPADTLLGRARAHLEELPSRVEGVDVERLESEVQALQEHLGQGEPAPGGVQLSLGDAPPASVGVAALSSQCPYCGERVTVNVEGTGASSERYVEDCPVCCRPWQVQVERSADGPTVQLSRDDD